MDKDKEKDVQEHYDRAKQHTLAERSDLSTYPLQVANNRLKDHLITRYVNIGARLLDMGCGKGGDGRRILAQRPNRYIGFDVSGESVKEATKRHGRSGARYFQGSMTLPGTFQQPWIQEARPFTVINTQFCLHYVWPEFGHVLNHLDTVVEQGTLWLGTLVDSTALEKFGAGNSVAKITDKTAESYVFSMPPLVTNLKESIVPWPQFVEAATRKGWQVVASGGFHELGFGRHLAADLQQVHYLYRFFVLVKR